MRFCALASGSKGNCFYVYNNDKAILVDAGISCKKIEEGLGVVGENVDKVAGVFLTHEHIDHIRGVDVFSRKYNLPVFGTKETLKAGGFYGDNFYPIKSEEVVKIGGMEVKGFEKSHDASNPLSFQVNNGRCLSIATDIGIACKNVQDAISESDFLVIESNHDISMLENGRYPWFLKNRILGEKGHLSNLHSAVSVLEHARKRLKNVVLAHLSENNNMPDIAINNFSLLRERVDLKPKVSVSLQEPSEVFVV